MACKRGEVVQRLNAAEMEATGLRAIALWRFCMQLPSVCFRQTSISLGLHSDTPFACMLMVISIVNIVWKLTSGLICFFKCGPCLKQPRWSYHFKIVLFKNISILPALLFGFQTFSSEVKEEGRTAVSKSKDMFEWAGRA